MKNCRKCKAKNCAYRDVAFKNMTIYCSENCPMEIHNTYKEVATPEFRQVFEQLKQEKYNNIGNIQGMLKHMECVINAADDIRN